MPPRPDRMVVIDAAQHTILCAGFVKRRKTISKAALKHHQFCVTTARCETGNPAMLMMGRRRQSAIMRWEKRHFAKTPRTKFRRRVRCAFGLILAAMLRKMSGP